MNYGPAFILVGVATLAMWWVSIDPSSAPADREYLSLYRTLYEMIPWMCLTLIAIGLFKTNPAETARNPDSHD